jgi:hypothetical protein
MGDEWGNFTVIRDFSTRRCVFEIHLAIDLGPIATDDRTEDGGHKIEKLLKRALEAGDREAEDLKEALRGRFSRAPNESQTRLIDAIVLRV